MNSQKVLGKFFKQTLLVFFIYSLSTEFILAQNKISGFVTDQLTNEAIAGAQVYLNGTTIGTTTTESGYFELQELPIGIFELAVSFIGYESTFITLNTSQNFPAFTFGLKPIVYEMDEILVTPDPKRWQEDYELFLEYFIGSSPFSKQTKILNPSILSFNYEPDERIFTASARERLIIENAALGYRIYYMLESFELNYAEGMSAYAGRPFFELMQSGRKRTLRKWKENRITAYNGSFLQFINTLIQGNSSEAGYKIQPEQRKDGTRYLSKEIMPQDSFFTPLDSTTYLLKFDDFLNITYTNELEDPAYLDTINSPFDENPRTKLQQQNSILSITQDSVLIDKSGYLFDPFSVLYEGYWGFEKISGLMPLNYDPEK